jgi:hypothetical protein
VNVLSYDESRTWEQWLAALAESNPVTAAGATVGRTAVAGAKVAADVAVAATEEAGSAAAVVVADAAQGAAEELGGLASTAARAAAEEASRGAVRVAGAVVALGALGALWWSSTSSKRGRR